MILILTSSADATANVVAKKLQQRGADFIIVDNGQFPERAEISVAYCATGLTRRLLHRDGETIDLSRITAAWYRRPLPPVSDTLIPDPVAREYVKDETRAFLDGAWHSLACLWVPAKLSRIKRGEDKITQLQLAGELGFELPPTLITNSPADFLEFYNQQDGRIISKVVHFPMLFPEGDWGSGYQMKTSLVANRDPGYAHSIRYCPVIFQAYVPKRFELRVTVVGQQVFACEIHSQHAHHTRHDWRQYDIAHTPHLVHELPEDVRRRCLQLVERMGLCYGAIDMVLTPDGRYVFLEINPNGQYAWIEDLTGLPISDAICNLLTSREAAATLSSQRNWEATALPVNGALPAARDNKGVHSE